VFNGGHAMPAHVLDAAVRHLLRERNAD
jgi:hypothetical protein